MISYLGEQPKGGNCLWLTTENGASFYYAHLDRWAPGLYEGMEVRSGELLGYVGNTGNAKYTPSHLHFGVNENDEMVNPYPILSRADRRATRPRDRRKRQRDGHALGRHGRPRWSLRRGTYGCPVGSIQAGNLWTDGLSARRNSSRELDGLRARRSRVNGESTAGHAALHARGGRSVAVHAHLQLVRADVE